MDRADLLGESGATFTIRYRGKQYTMSRMIGRCVAQWELFLRKRELTWIQERREVWPPDKYQILLDDYDRRLHDGEFSYESPHSAKVMQTTAGHQELIRILFREYHPDATDDELAELVIARRDEIEVGFKALMSPLLKTLEKKQQEEAEQALFREVQEPQHSLTSPTGPQSTAR